MTQPKIWIVDAFTTVAYKGNPAAVMIVNDWPQTMDLIAAEMNLSETAFLKPLSQNHFHLRWFTPSTEVKLCGHATLAAAHILFEQNKISGHEIIFDSLSGPLKVYKEKDGLVLDFPLQETTQNLDTHVFAQALNISHENIVEAVQAYDDVIVVLKDESCVRGLIPNITLLAQIQARGVIVTAYSGQQYDFISRFFAVLVGVDEDPVTGSAHCKLADYWQKKARKKNILSVSSQQAGRGN
jgi:PhzF family phenazine biosynthesis protein